MDDTATSGRRSRRGGGRDARRQLRAGGGAQAAPYIPRNIPPVDILRDEAAAIIEANAETILEE
ncbi:MAG: trimethylamine methyltransferase family protein, partial [Pseudomonadota bacterium]|nr:trimethylamine methyltransferase family protein [Pseudomonadota bacterium]